MTPVAGPALRDPMPAVRDSSPGHRRRPTRLPYAMRSWMTALRALLVCATATLGSVASADAADEVADVFAGIVRYSRWAEAPAVLRVCVNEQDPAAVLAITRRFAEETAPAVDVPGHALPVRVQVVSRAFDVGDIAALRECQAIYFGSALATSAQPLVTRLVTQLLNQPILTVGQGDDFCSRGGLFCLSPSEPGWRIRANLDSISRSGLRVNAQLLRLTQRDKGQS
ncbi:hypothetical protein BH11PSE8_BH11PSE8_38690 [soil metagenome]